MQDSDGDQEALKKVSNATPFSTFIWAVVSGDIATAEVLLADNIEWDLMPYNHKLKGKQEIIPWLAAGAASQKEPEVINNIMLGKWGVFEYWNIGTATRELIEFGKAQHWPFPKDPDSLIGQKYKVAQCFVYHIDSNVKIDRMRQYLDAGSVWAQFK